MRPDRGPPVAALQAALAAEHAAVWVYGLTSAFLTGDRAAQREEAIAAHRAQRDALERRLRAAGADPVAARPAYRVPGPVEDPQDAMRLAATAEADAAAAWHAVVARSAANTGLRRIAVDALTGAAVRATRWRAGAGLKPFTVAFPGRPTARG